MGFGVRQIWFQVPNSASYKLRNLGQVTSSLTFSFLINKTKLTATTSELL